MTTQLFNDEGEATLTLSGRLDTSVSSKVSNDIERLLATVGTIQHFTVDASHVWSYEGTTVAAGSPEVTVAKSTNYGLKFG